MKMLAILVCIAIGYVFGEMKLGEFGKENFNINLDARKAGSRVSIDDAKQAYSPDKNFRRKYANSNVFVQISASADSVKNRPSGNLFPVVATSTVKPSSKAIKNLEIMYLVQSEKHFKVDHPDITRPKPVQRISFDILKSFLTDKDSVGRKKKNPTNNTRQFLRRKRMAEVKDPYNALASLKASVTVREKLPVRLKIKVLKTDESEERLLDSYATANSAPSNLIAGYNAAKAAERKQLKEEVAKAGSEAAAVIDNYKALRKGRPWNYMKFRRSFKAFFAKPSTALTDYEALKRDEMASIDSFLGGLIQTENENESQNLGVEKVMQEEDKENPVIKNVILKDDKENLVVEKAVQHDDGENLVVEKGIQNGDRPKAGVTTEKIVQQLARATVGVVAVQVEAPMNLEENDTAYLKLLTKFNKPMKLQLMDTDAAEKRLLLSYTEYDYASQNLLHDYYAERKREINLLKQELAASGPKAAEILAFYKTIRKGIIWNYLKNENKARKKYFEKPSAGRSEYEALKRKELDIDRYLDGSLKLEDQAPEKDEKTIAEEIRRASVHQKETAKEEEEDRDRAETTIEKGEDPVDSAGSYMAQRDILSKLPEWLSRKITQTNIAEEKLIESYAKSNDAPSNLLANYNEAKTREREVLKLQIASVGAGAPDVIANYKALRKGSAWNSIKLQPRFKAFFEEPSAGLGEYEKLKGDELSFNNYLKDPSQVGAIKANKETKTEEENRMIRMKVEFDKAEEMERRVRANDVETVEGEEAAYIEKAKGIVATVDETKGITEILYGSPDNVTSADVTNTRTTTNTNDKDINVLFGFAILCALVMQVTIAILILAPQSDKLAKWCKRMKRTEATSARGETEPLHAGKKVPAAAGTVCKDSKSTLLL